MEIDAAQYAEMSREMLSQKNWLHLFDLETDYLDKPPFIFWISAMSMKLFGVSSFAYKLPSSCFAILSIYALYRFALVFYKERLALHASLVFASCQAIMLVTNDVRTDTILMGWVILAFWQFAAWYYSENKWGWVSAAICLAFGMMTKGPIALMIFSFGLLPHFLIKKDWKGIFKWQYVAMVLVIIVLLLPMSYGLYTQFDLHSEKLINGNKAVSGLRFFYWTQSFGRITGESNWDNGAPFYFLYLNLLWGLMPFTIFLLAASFRGLIKLIGGCRQTEWISTSAVILGYLSLGLSRFQLPHYIYVVLPFICLLIARYFLSIQKFYSHKFRILRLPNLFLFYLLTIALPLGLYYIFPNMELWKKLLLILIFICMILLLLGHQKNGIRLFPTLIWMAVGYNLLLSFIFYPFLFNYQKEYKIAEVIKLKQIDNQYIVNYGLTIGRSLDFNLNRNIPTISHAEKLLIAQYVLTDEAGLLRIKKTGFERDMIYQGLAYPISNLNLRFLNPETRSSVCKSYFLIRLK